MKPHLDPKLPHLFLKPGELFLASEPAIVSTILGSCLTVTVREAKARFFAMSHMMLPKGGLSDGFKYVDSTLNFLAETIEKLGISPEACEVKLFGGADVISALTPGSAGSIGSQNITEAYRRLTELRLSPKISDVGGRRGRRIFFNTSTGAVFVKKMRITSQ